MFFFAGEFEAGKLLLPVLEFGITYRVLGSTLGAAG